MASVAPSWTYRFSQNRSSSWTLLVELSRAHEQLLQEIETFGQVAADPMPEAGLFAAARWQLSQSSLRRRGVSARVLDFLSARLEGEDLIRVQEFRSADRQMTQQSAEHVRLWTISVIKQNWAGYCAASQRIRARMKDHIELEQRLLYPHLERLARRGA